MRFASTIFGPLLATVTMASALPEAMPETKGGLHKRAAFDPVKACKKFWPYTTEWSIVSTISHNIVFDPVDGLGSDFENGGAILLNPNCEVHRVAGYEPLGGGKGHEALMMHDPNPDEWVWNIVRVQVETLGDIWGIGDAKIWFNEERREPAFCSGTEHEFEGLDVDFYKVCNFVL